MDENSDLLSQLESSLNDTQVEENEELKQHREAQGVDRIYGFAERMNKGGQPITAAQLDGIRGLLEQEGYYTLINKLPEIMHAYYKENRHEHGMDNWPRITKIEAAIAKDYHMKFNEVSGQIEVVNLKTKKTEEANENSVWRRLEKAGIKCSPQYIKNLLYSDFVEKYNPFKDYFKKLSEWDGKTDHIGRLSNYIDSDHKEFFDSQFKKMLVRSIACSTSNYVNRTIFVLISAQQEIGKSTFLRFLSPFRKNGEDPYYTEAPLADNKDSTIRLSENFIYNLEELASLNASNVNQLKAIISTGSIKERRPHGHFEKAMPRRCNFWASANNDEFLVDDVNTRWLCFTVRSIDFGYSKHVDIDQVWSQAYALYKQEFDFELTKKEKAIRENRNKGYEKGSAERDLIARFLVPAEEEDHRFKTNTEIMNILTKGGLEFKVKLYSGSISRELGKLDYTKGRKRINGALVRGWYVKESHEDGSCSMEDVDEINEGHDAEPDIQEELPF